MPARSTRTSTPGDKAAERRFKEINEANAVLSDPAKRAKYDQFGRDWEAYARAGAAAGGAGGGDPFGPGGPFAGFGGSAAAAAGGAGRRRRPVRVPHDRRRRARFSDFFHMMFGDEAAAAGEPERSFARRRRVDRRAPVAARHGRRGAAPERRRARHAAARPAARRARPQPIEVTAELSLEEVVPRHQPDRRDRRPAPRGDHPARRRTGSRIRLTGKGPGGRDLVVVTKRQAAPGRSPAAATTWSARSRSPCARPCSGARSRSGPSRAASCSRCPPGTQNGRTFRLKGQGMPRFKGDGAGDLFVRVRVVLPTDLSDEAKAAATRFLDLVDQPDPRA